MSFFHFMLLGLLLALAAPTYSASAAPVTNGPLNSGIIPDEPMEMEEMLVTSKPLHLWDESDATTTQSLVRRNSGIPDLSQPFSRLPGVQVNEASGLGSKSTVIPQWAASSADAMTVIDGFPVVTPLGTGFDMSLIPASFISQVGVASAFDAFLPLKSTDFLYLIDLRPAPAGRLVLLPAKGANTLSLSYQDPLTGTMHGAISPKIKRHQLTLGAQILSSDGKYHFRNPVSEDHARRGHNDVVSGGGAVSHSFESESGLHIKNLLIAHHKERGIAGSLDFPSKDRERDDFHFLGTSLQTKYVGAMLSASHSRLGTYGDDISASPSSWSTTDRLYGSVAALQLRAPSSELEHAWVKPLVQIDHEFNWYESNSGKFHRNITGINGVFQVAPPGSKKFPLSGSLLIRQDLASEFSGSRDYRAALELKLAPRTALLAGFSYDHLYPSLTAFHGYVAGWGRVLGNESLGVERHRMWNVSANHETQKWKAGLTSYLDIVTNRSALRFVTATTSQYTNLPNVWNTGMSGDFTWLPNSDFSLRFAPSLSRAFDQKFKRDLAYKPRWQILASAGFKFLKRGSFFLEQTAMARRRYSSPDSTDGTGEDYIRALFLTALRLEWNFREGQGEGALSHQIFFRVNNLFDRAAWDYPGYPLPGRSFWVGYVLGG